MPLTIPGWLSAIFFHSIGEAADGLWKKVTTTAEDKVADYGRGFGDEHQDEELKAKLKVNVRPVWTGFMYWIFVDRNGIVTRFFAQRRQKQLRLFLTSWDKQDEKGILTTTYDEVVDGKVQKKQLVAQVFKPLSRNALGFVNRCVQIITEKEAEMIRGCTEQIPQMINEGKLPQGYEFSDHLKKLCREAGYRELVKYFEAAQLPIMPAPGDKHLAGSVDDWLISQVGSEFSPIELIQVAVSKAGAGMISEMERDKARMAAAKKGLLAPIKVPFAIIRNIFA